MIKDPALVTQVPELGPDWERQTKATAGWQNFKSADFQRLKNDFGVDWVVVGIAQKDGLACEWHNELLAVCRIP
jgi:hypothetical protein